MKNANPNVVSGNADATSQLSVTVRPVLTPPWTMKLARGRALRLISTPFQWSVCLPYASDRVTKLSAGTPNFSGLTAYSPVTAYPPPPGRSGFAGAAMLYRLKSDGERA